MMIRNARVAIAPAASGVRSSRFPTRKFATATSTPAPTFKASDLKIQKTTRTRLNEPIVFWKTFTDHMLEVHWTMEKGWEAPKIVPFHDLTVSPSITALHYGIQCFEGMKAYRDNEGNARLFRPDMNAKRLVGSCERGGLPGFDPNEFVKCLEELVRLDKEWIPKQPGTSLYIRPTAISTEEQLGISPPKKAMVYVIMTPVAPFYSVPLKLIADPSVVRVPPGGAGAYKLGSNYGSTIWPLQQVMKKGFSQLLWIYGDNHKVTECGTMNIFLYWINKKTNKPELTTPRLDGTILPGVTRDSILQLAKKWNDIEVSEKDIVMKDIVEAFNEGRMLEMFGSGTAAVVSPVELLHYQGKDYTLKLEPGQEPMGKLTKKIKEELSAIQYGVKPHPWSIKL